MNTMQGVTTRATRLASASSLHPTAHRTTQRVATRVVTVAPKNVTTQARSSGYHAGRPAPVVRASTVDTTSERASLDNGSSSGKQPNTDYFATDLRPVILFDGVCNLCNGAVNFMLDWDTQGQFRLAALQSPAGRALLARSGRSPDDISSIVLVDASNHYVKSEAVLRIGQKLNLPFYVVTTLLALPTPLPIRDAVYDGVANNRYSFFGRTESCRLSEPRFAERFLEL